MKNWEPLVLGPALAMLGSNQFVVDDGEEDLREHVGTIMLAGKVLVIELVAVDGFPTSALLNMSVTLQFEVGNRQYTLPAVKSPP